MKFRGTDYDQEFSFQKTVKTNKDKPKRIDESKSKERKQDYSKQRNLKRGEQQ